MASSVCTVAALGIFVERGAAKAKIRASLAVFAAHIERVDVTAAIRAADEFLGRAFGALSKTSVATVATAGEKYQQDQDCQSAHALSPLGRSPYHAANGGQD